MGGHGILCPPRLKRWGETSPVYPPNCAHACQHLFRSGGRDISPASPCVRACSQPLVAEITCSGFIDTCTFFVEFSINFNGVEGKFFSPTCKQHNNKERLDTDLSERLNFEQSFFKTVVLKKLLAKLHKK